MGIDTVLVLATKSAQNLIHGTNCPPSPVPVPEEDEVEVEEVHPPIDKHSSHLCMEIPVFRHASTIEGRGI